MNLLDKLIKICLSVVAGLVIINLLFIDLFLISKESGQSEKNELAKSQIIEPEVQPQPSPSLDFCGPVCQQTINEAVATLASQPQKTTVPFKTKPSETYIAVGAGSTSSQDWTDIPGAEVYIDTTKYGTIKEAYFEAQLRIPTANGSVCARIFNQTDKAFVYSSEVCSNSQKGERVTSSKINLYAGNKLYRIQMKISMPYEGILDLGRVKLIWE